MCCRIHLRPFQPAIARLLYSPHLHQCQHEHLLISIVHCRKLHADIFSGPVWRSPTPYTRNTVNQCASACNTGHACTLAPVFHTFDLPNTPKVLDAHAAAAILRINHAPIHTKPQRRLVVSVHGCSTIAGSAADEDGPRSEVVLVNSIIGCSLQATHVLGRTLNACQCTHAVAEARCRTTYSRHSPLAQQD